MPIKQSRRRLLSQLGVAGITGLSGIASVGFGVRAKSLTPEPPPEITIIKLKEYSPAICIAPHYAAEELLRAEGFTDVRYQTAGQNPDPALPVARNEADWDTDFAPNIIAEIAKGVPVTIVAGLHLGCYELIAHDHVRSIAGLKGRTVGWVPWDPSSKILVFLMAKSVGLDPNKDIHWASDPTIDSM
jgi:NitT/TauT family transport system substrate-binding protein